ncbi:MAG: glycosyltransferase [Muribaculaceae bacterium]|nr:glycosyltransferase [Muribaculaceae bacterium]
MLFSIITVCYNASATIARTLASVAEQSFADYEHLIIDGASTDATVAIVNARPDSRRHVTSEPDKGLYDAMNKGIAAAKGDYLIFLNAGDKFHAPDTLEKIAAAIVKADTPGIVYGQTLIVDNDGKALGPRHLSAPAELNLASFAHGMVVCHQAFVVLRRIAGFYNTRYRYSADYEWCIRCLQHSRRNVLAQADYLVDYLSEGITTANKLPSLRERFSIMSYYYGFFPTVFRHIGFIGRWWKRRNDKNK